MTRRHPPTRQKLLAILKKMEWSRRMRRQGTAMGMDNGPYEACCPVCYGKKPNHHFSCELAEALKWIPPQRKEIP